MSQKYLILLTTGQVQVDTEKIEVDERGNLNVWTRDLRTNEDIISLTANNRHWVAYMVSDGPPSIVHAAPGMMPTPFPPRRG